MTGIDVAYLVDELAFESDVKCREFIIAAGGLLDPTELRFDSKHSLAPLRASPLLAKKII